MARRAFFLTRALPVTFLGGALKMLDCTLSLQSTLHYEAIAMNSTTPNQRKDDLPHIERGLRGPLHILI